MIYNWLKNTLSGLFEEHCLLCLGPSKSKHSLCKECENELPKNDSHCLICSSPLSTNRQTGTTLVCGQCQKQPPYYNTSLIPHLYATPLKQLISEFKFHNNLSYGRLLAHLFIRSVNNNHRRLPECIIPVPLHTKRLQERGFNQALELARLVSRELEIPINYSLCKRNKITPFQSGLSAKQRKQNLTNAFSVTQTPLYKHVAIFDDVVTTGSTVNELSKQLKKSGVKIIEVWAIARTGSK